MRPEQQVLAARYRVSQAQAQRWPDFSVGGSLGLGALTLGALGHSASLSGSLLAGVSLPVFDAGAAQAQVRSQQSALEQAQRARRVPGCTAAWRPAVQPAAGPEPEQIAAHQTGPRCRA